MLIEEQVGVLLDGSGCSSSLSCVIHFAHYLMTQCQEELIRIKMDLDCGAFLSLFSPDSIQLIGVVYQCCDCYGS